METIFVYFSAIDEIDIRQTITSCLKNAVDPDRIHFGIVVQYNQYKKDTFKDFPNLKQIKIEFDEVLGVGATRQLAYLLHNNQTYCLQIDAHMIFNMGWDEQLIKHYNAAKEVRDKVILSGYAPSWYRDSDNNIYKEDHDESRSLTIVNDFVSAKQPILGFMKSESPIEINGLKLYEQKAISCHFIFSEMSLFDSILPDTFIIYNGDEATTSLRAISRGYRVYMPAENILWHLNKTKDNFYSNEAKRWQPMFMGKQPPNSEREIRTAYQAYKRVKDVFLGEILGIYGAETKEDLQWYSSYIGIDFKEVYDKQ
jgi:hypothetical protein